LAKLHRIQGSGFRVQGAGFMVQGSGSPNEENSKTKNGPSQEERA